MTHKKANTNFVLTHFMCYKRRKLVSVSAVGGFVLIYDTMGDKEIAS